MADRVGGAVHRPANAGLVREPAGEPEMSVGVPNPAAVERLFDELVEMALRKMQVESGSKFLVIDVHNSRESTSKQIAELNGR
jgi:hypothetical protein